MNSHKNNRIRIDLFRLHDPISDNSLRKCIMASGENLSKILQNLLKNVDKTKFIKNLMYKYNISYSSAERLAYFKKDWFPLYYIKEIILITNNSSIRFRIQDEIEFLKSNQPPQRIYKAVKFLNPEICKIAGAHAADGTLAKGNLLRITDGHESNIDVLQKWIYYTFLINTKKVRMKRSTEEWGIQLKSKVIGRYLNKIFGFPYGSKQYSVREPKIIRQSSLELRKAFALGAFTFESGVGIKHEVELCVSSKSFRDDLSQILTLSDVTHTTMKKSSGGYWRLWSGRLNIEESRKWMYFFEHGTKKWSLLSYFVDGYKRKGFCIKTAIDVLDKTYPRKSPSKITLKDVLEVIIEAKEVHRYELANILCKKCNITTYGGKWAHSLRPYLYILKSCNIIFIEKRKFGKKKSWGSIVREVYIFNENFRSWLLPYD